MTERELGIVLPYPDPTTRGPQISRQAERLEALGFDSLWVGDHLATGIPTLEMFTTLSAAAASTRRIRLGAGVLIPGMRQTAWTAKQIASLQFLSGERMILGVGSGGPWPDEWKAVGVDYAERGDRTDLALQRLPGLVTGQIPVAEASRIEPSTSMPPVLIGGASPAALRRVLKYGDGWFPSMVSPHQVDAGKRHLSECTDRSLTITVGVAAAVTPDRQLARSIAAEIADGYGIDADEAVKIPAVGSVQQVAEGLDAVYRAGADHLAVGVAGGEWDKQVEALAEVHSLICGAKP